jgi:hypothetical protein
MCAAGKRTLPIPSAGFPWWLSPPGTVPQAQRSASPTLPAPHPVWRGAPRELRGSSLRRVAAITSLVVDAAPLSAPSPPLFPPELSPPVLTATRSRLPSAVWFSRGVGLCWGLWWLCEGLYWQQRECGVYELISKGYIVCDFTKDRICGGGLEEGGEVLVVGSCSSRDSGTRDYSRRKRTWRAGRFQYEPV